MEHPDLFQLFNTSWTIHRLSPLHHGKDCETLLGNEVALKAYETRLREHLTGEVLAGVQADTIADDGALAKTGALNECLWQPISPSREMSESQGVLQGILVTLEYENITYKAALLTDSSNDRKGSTSLPLVLTRFPTALRQTFLAFLSANFDTYTSPLRLPSNFICVGLETYIGALQRAETVETIRELQLTLSFSPSIAPDLKSLNVNISRAALSDFLRAKAPVRGQSLKQKMRSPLIDNLTSYLEEHLAMKLDLDGSDQAKQHVRLSKIVCASFVLGGEGRLKLVATDKDDDENKSALEAGETLLKLVARRAVAGDQPTT
ncbi:hypothetical protein N7452_010344 [Penicillium brevicompactum]|uniref:Uncharacterized protein n=1 Tax=Penicillium brevicompactum TaxID=5074 RepID=A0A9W9QA55_PENBR|nr:hypothetical protein N7452_010344 [Penicillium brevicompactum]